VLTSTPIGSTLIMIKQVDVRAVEKDLVKTPKTLVIKFQKWVDDIEKYGLGRGSKSAGLA
jgi:hypothetical protein